MSRVTARRAVAMCMRFKKEAVLAHVVRSFPTLHAVSIGEQKYCRVLLALSFLLFVSSCPDSSRSSMGFSSCQGQCLAVSLFLLYHTWCVLKTRLVL